MEEVASAMQLGAYNEAWMELAGVPLPGTPVHPGNFTFEALGSLTAEYISDPTLEAGLADLVQRAKAAADAGDVDTKERLLARYAAILDRLRGVAVPAVQTDALVVIAKSL
jgi:hypothetical protein